MHASKAILKYNRYLIIANQSNYDKHINHPKIQANMAIIESNIHQIRSILGNNSIQGFQIIKMMSKKEYSSINRIIQDIPLAKNTTISLEF
jgi:hypothetical protein